MEALKAIMTRRSVRQFTKEPVSEADITQILHAAMSAPSAINEQPWHFLVIDDRHLLDKICAVHPHAAMCTQAPLVIVPCIDLAQATYRDFWFEDMSAATQNILLAARALELGSVWVGVYPDAQRVIDIRKLFALPESVTPFAVIPIGHSNIMPKEAPERIKPERIHRNKW